MKQNILHKAVLFLMLLVAGNAYAGGTSYYTKAIAKAVGSGKVYVSTSSDAPADTDYKESESSAELSDASQSRTDSYKLYAKSTTGYAFDGWYTDEACTEGKSTDNPLTVTIAPSGNSTASKTATTETRYAKFVEASAQYQSSVTIHASSGGKVFVSADSGTTPAYDDEVSAKVEHSGEAEHTYYLKAKADDDFTLCFAGWYSDEACTQLISMAPAYSYKVKGTEETGSTSAEAEHIYSKFVQQNPYQLRNSGFEVWNDAVNEPAPGWNSFPSATGSYSNMSSSSPSPKRVQGVSGYAVELTSISVMGIANANGNLTTGRVNMGDMNAKSAANHNFTDVENKDYYMIIKGQPDGVEFYSKFTASSSNQAKAGNAKFIIHDKCTDNYKDPEVDSLLEHRIGLCNVSISPSTEWTKQTGTFAYDWNATDAAATDKYILVDFTTNITPGESAGDVLTIDEVTLVYNSELSAATYDGKAVTLADGEATVDAAYDESKLVLESNGRGATIEKSYDANTYKLTIVVKGNDFSENAANKHEYAIQFAKAEPATVTELSSPITISINGQTSAPIATDFKFEESASGYGLRMENFILSDGTTTIPIGTLVIKNVDYAEGKVSTEQTVLFEAGNLPGIGEDEWLGLMLNQMGGVPIKLDGTLDKNNKELKAVIDIDMSETISQVIRVVVAPVTTISDTEMISTGLQNVKIDRTFVEGWNTVCLPFEWTSALLSDATEVQLFTGFDNNVITFAPTDDPIPANTPCLVLFNASNANPYYFGADVQDLTPKKVTFNGATFKGNYTPNYDMNGKYGVVINEGVSKIMKGTSGSAINPGRAFFDIPDAANVREMAVSLEGHEGEATAIDGVKVVNADAPIYNLQGIKTNGKGHGVFIQNGKVIIK